MAEERVQRRLAAIISADVVGYSKLMEEDETGTLARLQSLRAEFLHPKVAEYGGRIVKTTGDGTLIEFASAVDAVSHALDVQRGMSEREADVPDDARIRLRIGINVGDIIIDGDDIYGDGVNVAARLEALAEPDGICISERVHDYVQGRVDIGFEDLGEQSVKNIARPIRVYRVRIADPTRTTAADRGDLPPLPDNPSVAVLPFVNMSGDPEQEYFADGVTEDIITDLSKVSGLFVIGRQSSFVYKGKSIGLRQVGNELGVRYVLEGSVRKAGNRVRITAQLIESKTDNHVWAERYDRDLGDIFAVQEEVARNVVEALAVTLRPEEGARLARVPTQNLRAYDAFVRARVTIHPPTADNLAQGRRLFERTVALDPGFAGGHAGLSYVDSLAIQFGHIPKTADSLENVTALAEKAIALDETFGWSFTVLGFAKWVAGAHDEAVAAARQAVALQPGDPETHAALGLIMTYAGLSKEAIPHIERAIRLNPTAPGIYLNFLGYAHAMAGNSRIAIDTLNRIVPGAYSPGTFSWLILAYVEDGEIEKAKETAEFALERYPHMTTSTWMATLMKERKDTERVARALRAAGIPD